MSGSLDGSVKRWWRMAQVWYRLACDCGRKAEKRRGRSTGSLDVRMDTNDGDGRGCTRSVITL